MTEVVEADTHNPSGWSSRCLTNPLGINRCCSEDTVSRTKMYMNKFIAINIIKETIIMDMELVRVALNNLETGLRKYQKVFEQLHAVDVSKDEEFQRNYNGFYRMRQRKPEFYSSYYQFMEEHKNDAASELNFEMVLSHFYRMFNRIEASFSSKLLSIINPNMPVWDKYVLENLRIKAPAPSDVDRLQKTISIYEDICAWYQTFLLSEDARKMISMFDEVYPGTQITNVKKVDLILWQIR